MVIHFFGFGGFSHFFRFSHTFKRTYCIERGHVKKLIRIDCVHETTRQSNMLEGTFVFLFVVVSHVRDYRMIYSMPSFSDGGKQFSTRRIEFVTSEVSTNVTASESSPSTPGPSNNASVCSRRNRRIYRPCLSCVSRSGEQDDVEQQDELEQDANRTNSNNSSRTKRRRGSQHSTT